MMRIFRPRTGTTIAELANGRKRVLLYKNNPITTQKSNLIQQLYFDDVAICDVIVVNVSSPLCFFTLLSLLIKLGLLKKL